MYPSASPYPACFVLGAIIAERGPLPEFLTLYELESNAVLASPSYRELLVTPTPWSRSMRPSFRGFFRVGHRAVLSHGGGVGSALMAATFEDGEAAADAWQEVAEQVLAETAATAVHVLRKDPAVAPVPFAVPSSGETSHPDGGAIMIESHERSAFAEIARVLDPALEMRGLARGRASWTVYDLAYLLDKEELPVVVALSRLEA